MLLSLWQCNKYIYQFPNTIKRFSTKKACLKFNEENKPIYSKKQIVEAIKNNTELITAHLPKNSDKVQYNSFNEYTFKKELNL